MADELYGAGEGAVFVETGVACGAACQAADARVGGVARKAYNAHRRDDAAHLGTVVVAVDRAYKVVAGDGAAVNQAVFNNGVVDDDTADAANV